MSGRDISIAKTESGKKLTDAISARDGASVLGATTRSRRKRSGDSSRPACRRRWPRTPLSCTTRSTTSKGSPALGIMSTENSLSGKGSSTEGDDSNEELEEDDNIMEDIETEDEWNEEGEEQSTSTGEKKATVKPDPNGKIRCKLCGHNVFATQMSKHMREEHSEQYNKDAKYSCNICQAAFFNTKRPYRKHVQLCRVRNKDPRIRNNPKMYVPCECPFCGFAAEHAYKLSYHITKEHASITVQVTRGTHRNCTFNKPFACTACPVTYSKASGLAVHWMKMEDRGKPCGGELTIRTHENVQDLFSRYDNSIAKNRSKRRTQMEKDDKDEVAVTKTRRGRKGKKDKKASALKDDANFDPTAPLFGEEEDIKPDTAVGPEGVMVRLTAKTDSQGVNRIIVERISNYRPPQPVSHVKVIPCRECGKSVEVDKMREHCKKEHHTAAKMRNFVPGSLHCKICGDGFDLYHQFIEHYKLCNGNSEMESDDDYKESSSAEEGKFDMKVVEAGILKSIREERARCAVVHHLFTVIKCPICEVPCFSFFDLGEHLLDHHSKLHFFICIGCFTTYESAHDLKRHLMEQMDREVTACSLSGRVLSVDESRKLQKLDKHLLKTGQSASEEHFKLKKVMISTEHYRNDILPQVTMGIDTMNWDLIESYEEEEKRANENKKNFRENPPVSEEEILKTMFTPFDCSVCRTSSSSMFTLFGHMQKHGEHQRCTYDCNGCGVSFFDPAQLREHLVRQRGNEQFACFDSAILGPSKAEQNTRSLKHQPSPMDDNPIGSLSIKRGRPERIMDNWKNVDSDPNNPIMMWRHRHQGSGMPTPIYSFGRMASRPPTTLITEEQADVIPVFVKQLPERSPSPPILDRISQPIPSPPVYPRVRHSPAQAIFPRVARPSPSQSIYRRVSGSSTSQPQYRMIQSAQSSGTLPLGVTKQVTVRRADFPPLGRPPITRTPMPGVVRVVTIRKADGTMVRRTYPTHMPLSVPHTANTMRPMVVPAPFRGRGQPPSVMPPRCTMRGMMLQPMQKQQQQPVMMKKAQAGRPRYDGQPRRTFSTTADVEIIDIE